MKPKLLLSLLLILFVGNCCGQVMFQSTIGGADTGYLGNCIHQTIDGGYIITGFVAVDPYSGAEQTCLIKINSIGSFVWSKIFNSTYTNNGTSVQQTVDGGYIVTGSIKELSPINEKLYLIRTDTNGDTLWTKSYGGTNYAAGNSVQQTFDGGYIVTGETIDFGAGGLDVYLIKTDASGDTLWTRTFGGAKDDYGYSIEQTNDSGYIICGSTKSFGVDSDNIYLIKTDVNGNLRWSKTYGGTGDAIGYSVQQTNDDGYIIGGYELDSANGDKDVALIKTDGYGNLSWSKIYGGSNNDVGQSVCQTKDSGYVITGWTQSFGSSIENLYYIRTNTAGDTLSTKNYGGSIDAVGYSVQQTNDNECIITGFISASSYSSNIYVLKTDINGNGICNENNPSTMIKIPNIQVTSPVSLISSGAIVGFPPFIISNGSSDSTICSNVGINELTSNNTISIYPNPTSNELIIKNAEFRIKNIAIYNVLGQEVQGNQYSIINNQYSINVAPFASGIYFVRLAGEKDVWVGKFVKE